MTMKAFLLTAPRKIELVDVDLPDVGDDEILCQTMYTAISPGTYLQRYLGSQPNMAEYPYVPGYLNVGRVVQVGRDVRDRGFAEGDVVHVRCFNRECLPYRHYNGSDAEYTVIAAESLHHVTHAAQHPMHLAFAIFGHLGLAAAMASQCSPDKTALVVGQGILGSGCTRAFALAGARQIVAVDLMPRRLEIATRLGATDTCIGGEDMVDILNEKYPDKFDIVVEASGNPKALAGAVGLSRSGDVYLVSLYNEAASVFFGDFRRRRIIGLPRDGWWMKLLHRMMDTGIFMVDEIISDIIEPTVESMQWAYEALLNEPEDHLGILVDWTGETEGRRRVWE